MDMDTQRLAALAINAIQHALRFRLGPEKELSEADKEAVMDCIEELFPLRHRARDIMVAHLEIACDAAVGFIEAYNEDNPETQHINARWFYGCVQNLLSMDLKPELHRDGRVDRLSVLLDEQGSSSSTESEADSEKDPPEAQNRASSEEESSAAEDGGRPAAPKEAAAKWDQDEMKLMVHLKKSGMTHKEVAARLGRTKSAVENKYGRYLKREMEEMEEQE